MLENGSSPTFHYTSLTTNSKIVPDSITNSLKVPLSQSVNAKLSLTSENSLRPESLNIKNKEFFTVPDCTREKMTSVESIGTCSIDFEASEMAEVFENKHTTASEFTLQSSQIVNGLNSLGGKQIDLNKSVKNGSHLTNGHKEKDKKQECTVAEIKLPSYVSISCAINGYTNYSQFCRSRDNSPARITFRKSSLEANFSYDKKSKDETLTNRLSAPNVRCSRSLSDCNGNVQSLFTESRHVNISKQLQIPLTSPKKYTTEIVISNGHSSDESFRNSLTSTDKQFIEEEFQEYPLAKEVGNGTKSLVQQRIESLYGDSAVQKAKLPCRTSRSNSQQLNKSVTSSTKRSPSCPPQKIKNQIDNDLPVFRHLTKDFREQLLLDDASQSSNFAKKSTNLKTCPLLTEHGQKSVDVVNIENQEFHSLPNGINRDECDKAVIMESHCTTSESPRIDSKNEENFSIKEKDGYIFLSLMESEKNEIKSEILKWEELLLKELPEEASGKIRVACGKANLLLSQKFEQFRGLCYRNIEECETDQFYTTASDLAGFWDMVMLQVKDVKSTFNDLQLMKENSWQEINIKKGPISQQRTKKLQSNIVSRSNPCTPKRSAKSAELAKAREEARKQLIAAKKKARQQNTGTNDSDVSIFTPES